MVLWIKLSSTVRRWNQDTPMGLAVPGGSQLSWSSVSPSRMPSTKRRTLANCSLSSSVASTGRPPQIVLGGEPVSPARDPQGRPCDTDTAKERGTGLALRGGLSPARVAGASAGDKKAYHGTVGRRRSRGAVGRR